MKESANIEKWRENRDKSWWLKLVGGNLYEVNCTVCGKHFNLAQWVLWLLNRMCRAHAIQ